MLLFMRGQIPKRQNNQNRRKYALVSHLKGSPKCRSEELWVLDLLGQHTLRHGWVYTSLVFVGKVMVRLGYYCQPDVRNSYKFVILNYLANSCTVWLQFLDAYYRPFSDGIPTVSVDEGGFLASYLFRWLSRLPKNNNQTITTVN